MMSESQYCCAEHGHVPASQMCSNHGHLFDTLYPKSAYRCSNCGEIHGTTAVNGAVYWGCLSLKPGCNMAGQQYLGRWCSRCGELIGAAA